MAQQYTLQEIIKTMRAHVPTTKSLQIVIIFLTNEKNEEDKLMSEQTIIGNGNQVKGREFQVLCKLKT